MRTHDEMIKDSGKGSERQVGGDHYKDCEIKPLEYIIKKTIKIDTSSK